MAHNSIIGKNMLQMLMFSLYPEPETIYREYLQNASDSILEAKKAGILNADEGHVSITINEIKQQILINDDGIGIPCDKAESVLKDIASSPKKNKSYVAGFYGIGRLVGAGYCKQLVFRTSYKGETEISELVIDVQKIRDCLKDENNMMTATEVLDSAAIFSVKNGEDENKHYFEVSLNEILPEYSKMLLDENRIKDYLVQVAPVDYKPEFKSSLVQPSLETAEESIKAEIEGYVENLNCVRISLNNIVDIRKRYSYKIEGLDDEIDTLRYFILKNRNFGTLAWGWYAVTPFTKQIPDTDSKSNQRVLTRGMRLRIKNIQIGDETFFDGTSYFKQTRSNKYFNGEIHVVNENITPTTDRSNLAPSEETEALKEQLIKFFNDEMQAVYQKANKAKTTLNELIKIEGDQERLSKKKQQNSLSEFEKDELKKIPDRREKVLKDIKQYIEAPAADKTSKRQGELFMLNIYQKRLSKVNKDIESGTVSIAEKRIIAQKSDVKSQPAQNDFSGLEEKYSAEQIEMAKRIFDIIDTNFYTDAYKRITRGIKSTILKELKK